MLTNFLIFFLLLVSVGVTFTIFANIREARAAENWAQTFGDIEDIPKQYPFRNDNDAAVKLEILTNRLGFDFAWSQTTTNVRKVIPFDDEIREAGAHFPS